MAKILIIDDDAVVRDALEVFLARDGHQVLTAADGGNGALAFRQSSPDLVVLDRDLPVMTGSAVLKKIRGISASTPVLMLTGHDSREGEEKYLALGATAFLSKKDGLLNALNEIDRLLGKKRSPPAPAAPAAAGTPPAAAGPKGAVLLADDDEALRGALRRFLSSCGYEVLEAGDGDLAVAIAKARRPDVVVLDLLMPGKDGVEALRELVPALPGTGFIMLSGNDDDQVARACLRIGASNYVAKPPDMEALELLIRNCVLACGRR